MDEKPSTRLIDQRLRNRIIEAVAILAAGDDGVRRQGYVEYFDRFYDVIPHRQHGEMYPNSAVTAGEMSALRGVSSILDDACDATPANMADEDFIATGWPQRVQSPAMETLGLMRNRGRFSEDVEENTPSPHDP